MARIAIIGKHYYGAFKNKETEGFWRARAACN